MYCFVAHTGARRSELLRAEVGDVDLTGESVLLRERKRVHGKRTTRRVPLSPFLRGVLEYWLSVHPGGNQLFCQSKRADRSKKSRTAPMPFTVHEAQHHFHCVLRRSQWEVPAGLARIAAQFYFRLCYERHRPTAD